MTSRRLNNRRRGLSDFEDHYLSRTTDFEFHGEILQDNDERGTVLFKEAETGKEVVLPRSAISIMQHVVGVIVTIPSRIAKSRGLA